ncbi:hypothetical protein NL108_013764 [Boleophthalmus pectinirostris]|nr:hypothetical protein NL108_013764 [Boleophthalmus pectinirostris]
MFLSSCGRRCFFSHKPVSTLINSVFVLESSSSYLQRQYFTLSRVLASSELENTNPRTCLKSQVLSDITQTCPDHRQVQTQTPVCRGGVWSADNCSTNHTVAYTSRPRPSSRPRPL